MSKRDPHDPAGEYERHVCVPEDCYCAQEGWSQAETQDDVFDVNRAAGWEPSAGEVERESTEDLLRHSIADLTEAINASIQQSQYLIDMKRDLAHHLNMLSDARSAPRNEF